MPAVPDPVIGNLGPFWSAVFASLKATAQQGQALAAGSIAGITPDRWGNAIEVYGPNLNQAVTIGADLSNPASPKPGVQVSTGLTGSGLAIQNSLATGTITTTKGSAAATLASGTGFANGMVIGAANVSDPSSGVATPAISPGTTISSGGGTTSITLSQAAVETGSGLYCAACFWSNAQGGGNQPFLQLLSTQQLQLAYGRKAAYWAGVGVVGQVTLTLNAADVGLNTILGGVVFPWPLTTWAGVQLLSTGNFAAAPPNMQASISNSNTAQSFDAFYIVVGN